MVQIYEDRVIADTADLKNEVLGTLTAVPGVLLETFYNIGGKIQVGKTATTQCANTSIADSEIDFIGSENSIQTCWKQTSPEEAPVILIAGNKDLIRHSLVRLFGYMFTEFFVARLGSENAPTQYKDPEWVEAVESFKAMRSTLANAFLNDLAQVDKPAHKRLSAFSSADTTRFENYVFAEALDSYYCSDDTRYVFQQNYREAYKVFTDKSNPEAPAVQFGDMDDSN